MSSTLCVGVFGGIYPSVHKLLMDTDIPAILRGIAVAANIKQTGLGELIGVSQPQISRYMNGSEPGRGPYEKIMQAARKLRVIPEDIRSEDVAASLDKPPERMTKVKGYVGAGSEMNYYRVADEDLEEVSAPDGASNQTVAAEIRGKSLGPRLNTWLVFYDDVRSPVTDDLIGKLCVVGLTDDQVVVKEIQRRPGGKFVLLSNTDEPPMEDVTIEWAAKVINMRPR